LDFQHVNASAGLAAIQNSITLSRRQSLAYGIDSEGEAIMAVELYNKDGHVCLAFYDLVD